MLPNGASRTDLRSYDLLQQYVAKNAEKWYEYVTVERGFDAPNGSLYIITGCDKCEHWELAAFHNPSYQQEDFAFQITVNNSSGAILGTLTHTAVLDCSVGHRRSISVSTHGRPNQAVFLRGFKISIKTRESNRRKGRVKLLSLEDSTFEVIKQQGKTLSFSQATSSSNILSNTSSSLHALQDCTYILNADLFVSNSHQNSVLIFGQYSNRKHVKCKI
jgi:hypothetical protein